jgi:hypothetical protein
VRVGESRYLLSGVAEPHHFNAVPVPVCDFNADSDPDPDLVFHSNADPDPASLMRIQICNPASISGKESRYRTDVDT